MPHHTSAAGREAGRPVCSLSPEQGHLSLLNGTITLFLFNFHEYLSSEIWLVFLSSDFEGLTK